ITRLWRTSKTLGPRSHLRHATFSGALDSPPPTEPSLMEWDHMYCNCHSQPRVKCRCSEACRALKVLFPSFRFRSTCPTPESWRVQIPAARSAKVLVQTLT